MNEVHPNRNPWLPMDNNLIEVGIGVFHGKGHEVSAEQAARELVKRALEKYDSSKLPVRFALLMATADWCQPGKSVSKHIRTILQEELGYLVPLVGGSSSQLYVSTEADLSSRFIKNGIWLVLFFTEDMWLTVTSLTKPYSYSPEERKRLVADVARKLETMAGSRLGTSANRFLFGFLPGVVKDEFGQRAYYDHELHQDILAALNHRHLFFGASTADKLEPETGYQFVDDECIESSLALAMLETDLLMGAAMSNGFSKSEAPRVSVDDLADSNENDSGYELKILDGKPAVERIRQLKDKNEDWVKFDRPIFGLPNGSDYDIYWPLEPVSPSDNTVRLKRKVVKGDGLYLLKAVPEKMLDTARQTVENAIDKSTVKNRRFISLLVSFLCGGRGRQFEMLKIDWKKTVEQTREQYHPIPIVGGLTAGEFGIDDMHKARSNNMGISVIAPANSQHRRARVGYLSRVLIGAASDLLTCKTKKEVMKKALEGAIRAGATGGKINVVDNKLKRILGKYFGEALNAENSEEDWISVAKFTDYEAPSEIGGDFPVELRDTSMSIVPDELQPQLNFVKSIPTRPNGEREDILQLAIRARHAIYLPDSTIYKNSLVNKDGCEAGNIKSQLVIPLIGGDLKVIATIQLSFPDETPPDRETLVLWISYAQSIAAALVQAEEHELRKSLETISDIGNRIMNNPLTDYQTPYDWCREYLVAISKLIKSDGANIRTLERVESEEGKSYRLRASTGIFGRILEDSRLEIPESDPGFHKQFLEEGGKFINEKQQVELLFSEMQPLENPERYRDELKRILGLIEATAILPFKSQNELIGAIYIYSTKQYFFTERQQKLALTAAELGGSILKAKTTEYQRMELDRQLAHLEELLSLSTEGTASERFRLMIRRVCETVGADVGSVFAWHEKSQKLVLHTEHNWQEKGNEGKVGYEKGEGWTGSMVEKDDNIIYMIHPNSEDNEATERDIRKHYKLMIPKNKRSAKKEARIGIKLFTKRKLLGVLTLVYYREHTSVLSDQVDFITSFLEGAAKYISLCFELVEKEARDDRTMSFIADKEKISNFLVDDTYSSQNWQWALDEIRKNFEVIVLTYYQLQDGKLIKSLSSPSQGDSRPKELLLPSDVFNKIIEDQMVVRYPQSKNDLSSWPDDKIISNISLMAVPIVTSSGDTVGLLEFISKSASSKHPFEWFDSLDLSLAQDIARTIARAIERKEKEELNIQLKKAMEVGGRGLFSTILMHQIKSPFAHMRGIIDWLLKHPDSPMDERASYLSYIEKYYAQALETISQASQSGEARPRRQNLQTIISEAIRFVTPDIQAKDIQLQENNELFVEVYVDLMSVSGALVNLLSNAIEAMQKKGTLTISTELSSDSLAAYIRIHNTGEPLTKADITKFSEPGVSTKRKGEHLGLGVWLATQAIYKTGGTLSLNPTADGVEAIISLPLADKRSAISQGPKEFYYD